MGDVTDGDRKMVVGLDGSKNAAAALVWAVGEARVTGISVEVSYVWQVPSLAYSTPGYIPMSEEDIEKCGRQALDVALAGVSASDRDVKVSLRCVEGSPTDVLIAAAREADTVLVTAGARGHGGVAGLLLGSVSHALAHRCPKPLAIVPFDWDAADHDNVSQRVVVGVDGSKGSVQALEWAAAEASARGARLEAVMVSSVPLATRAHLPLHAAAGAELHEKLTDLLRDTVAEVDTKGINVDCTVVAGHPAAALIDRAADAQLLVVGSRGRGWAREVFLGSVSYACAQKTAVPVVIVPTGDRSEF